MKGNANIVSGVHNLKQAYDHFGSFERDNPNSIGAKLFRRYNKAIHRIVLDLLSMPYFTDEVRDGIRAEWNSDVFTVPAIAEKSSLLNPQQREMIEEAIDKMLDGKSVRFDIN